MPSRQQDAIAAGRFSPPFLDIVAKLIFPELLAIHKSNDKYPIKVLEKLIEYVEIWVALHSQVSSETDSQRSRLCGRAGNVFVQVH
jgi:hypothetical protein